MKHLIAAGLLLWALSSHANAVTYTVGHDFGDVPYGEIVQGTIGYNTSQMTYEIDTDTWMYFPNAVASKEFGYGGLNIYYWSPEISLTSVIGCGYEHCVDILFTSTQGSYGEVQALLWEVYNEYIYFANGSEQYIGGNEREYPLLFMSYTPVPVPLPVPFALMLTALASLGYLGHKKSRSKNLANS
ncbi:MAG: hypothetical protein ACR2OJ_02230 [Hyphomicrobiales bacterium]